MHGRTIGGLVLLMLGLAGAAMGADRAALADAAEQRDTARVRTLLEARPDVNVVNAVNAAQPDGTTALHWTAYHDDAEMAGLLVRAGANVNAVSKLGRTPLLIAATIDGSVEVVRLLIEKGADVNVRDKSGSTALALLLVSPEFLRR